MRYVQQGLTGGSGEPESLPSALARVRNLLLDAQAQVYTYVIMNEHIAVSTVIVV
jgi:hypothetical protein